MKPATSEAIATTKAQLTQLERQAMDERIQELTTQGREARKHRDQQLKEFHQQEKKFYKLQGEFDIADRACEKLYAKILELQRELAPGRFPTEEEASQLTARIAELQTKLNAAREQRMTAKNEREKARDAALKTNAEYQSAAISVQRLAEAIEKLQAKTQGVRAFTGVFHKA